MEMREKMVQNTRNVYLEKKDSKIGTQDKEIGMSRDSYGSVDESINDNIDSEFS